MKQTCLLKHKDQIKTVSMESPVCQTGGHTTLKNNYLRMNCPGFSSKNSDVKLIWAFHVTKKNKL